MKAQELRIGNWVTTVYPINKQPFQVYPMWFKQLPTDKNHDLILHTWEPIPLTEKWLIDFDFERGVDYWFKGDVILDISPEGLSYRFHYNIIQYVHQLQNLYFALTGEELQL